MLAIKSLSVFNNRERYQNQSKLQVDFGRALWGETDRGYKLTLAIPDNPFRVREDEKPWTPKPDKEVSGRSFLQFCAWMMDLHIVRA
jgi:hypothetical protein